MKRTALFLGSILILASCEKVIDVDLNTAEPQTVVEAAICADDTVNHVILSTSGRYTDSEGLGPITGAVVTVADDQGNSQVLTEVEAGKYKLDGFSFTLDDDYSLKVENDNLVIDATSSLKAAVNIDTLFFEEFQGGFGFGGGGSDQTEYRIRFAYQEPAGVENFYRARLIVNDTARTEITVFDDALNDGNYIEQGVRGQQVLAGDTVVLELWSIDRASYDYYRTLADIISSFGALASTPYNPISNLSGGLGQFTMYSKSTRTAVVVP